LVITDSVSGATATVAANATGFTLAPAIASGATYNVSVTGQPASPTESCSVTSGGTGTASANVTNIVVTCAVSTFTVGGTLTGATVGAGLTVKDTVSGNIKIVPAGATTFAITPAVNSGSNYAVTVTVQPTSPVQTCSVVNGTGSGTVTTANVTSVVINCVTATFTVGGTITGLNGSGLVLTDSVSGHTVTKNSPAASFTLVGAVNSGTNYNVTVTTQPSTPAQFCTVTGGAGTVTTQNVATISVSCKNVGQFVWVTNPFDSSGNGSLAAFNINATTGALTPATGSPYTSSNNTSTEYQPYAIVADPSGLFVYVANSGCVTYTNGIPGELPCVTSAGTVGIHGVNSDGSLSIDAQSPVLMSGNGTATATPDTSVQPFSLTVNPTGPYLYVGTFDSAALPSSVNLIEGFSISTPGTLSALTGSPYADGYNPSSNLVVDYTNSYLYSANPLDNSLYGFCMCNAGALTPNSSSPYFSVANPYAEAASPTGAYLYVADNIVNKLYVFSYDGSGNLNAVANYPVGSAPEGIAIDPTGKFLYVTNSGAGTVSGFTINSNGTLVSMGSAFTATTYGASTTTPTAIAVDPSSQFVYVANGDAGTMTAFKIGANGALSPVGGSLGSATVSTILGGGGPSSIAIR
jgi:6-phosphogluconolactonase (cycloisomerase 2 family)